MSDEQISLDTKIGQVKAQGVLMPVIVLGLTLLGGSVWFLHGDAAASLKSLDDHTKTMAVYQHETLDRLDTLIRIQCAALRQAKSTAIIAGCF